MTRINAGISPQKLSRQHLLAEHREIKRIPNAVSAGKAKLTGIPEKFCLGPGHVKFFYNKLLYLFRRYQALHNECLYRGYKVQDYSEAWDDIPLKLMNDWEPTEEASRIVQERINERTKDDGA